MGASSSGSTPVGLGLVGCGRVGEDHIRGLRCLYQAGERLLELRALCSRTRSRAEELAEVAAEFQGRAPRVYVDYEDMIADPEVSALDICTAHGTHHTIGCRALESGKHCLIEKPLALTVAAARLLVEAASRHGRVLAVAENYRRQTRFRTIKWMLEQRLLGDIISVILLDSAYGNQVIDDTPWRHSKRQAGPGQILDRGSHHCDLFEYLLGPVERVYGRVSLETPERHITDARGRVIETVSCDAEDTCHGLLHFAAGGTGIWYLTSSGHGQPFDQRSPILMGTKGSFRDEELALDEGKRRSLPDLKQEMLSRIPVWQRNAWFPAGLRDEFAIELHDFAHAVAGEGQPEVDGKQGLRSVALAYAFCESSALGQPVPVSDVETGKVSVYQEPLNRELGLSIKGGSR